MRPCDLHAVAIQDRVFLEGRYVERDYAQRRGGAFVVAVNCGEPGGTCFCASMGTGPRAETGFDLALTELADGGHRFLVEVGSERGRALLAALPVRPATEDDRLAAVAVTDHPLDTDAHGASRTTPISDSGNGLIGMRERATAVGGTFRAGPRPGGTRPQAGPPARTNVWLDPPTARVLDRASSNSGLIRTMHLIHGSMMIPIWGRSIVGWLGVAMLFSCFTGIWLWWPTVGKWVRGLRWRRHRKTAPEGSPTVWRAKAE